MFGRWRRHHIGSVFLIPSVIRPTGVVVRVTLDIDSRVEQWQCRDQHSEWRGHDLIAASGRGVPDPAVTIVVPSPVLVVAVPARNRSHARTRGGIVNVVTERPVHDPSRLWRVELRDDRRRGKWRPGVFDRFLEKLVMGLDD